MVPPVHVNWRAFATSAADSTGATVPYCAGVAPPAELALLAGLAHLVRAGATTPYASQGLTPDTSQTPVGYYWQFGHVVGPAVYAAQGVYVVSTDGVETPPPDAVSTWAYMSGAGAADEVRIENSIAEGSYDSPPRAGGTTTVRAEPTFNASPTAASNRLYEVTATLQSTAEKFYGKNFNGCCVRVFQSQDLTQL